mgnify:CR=1 FL=1
MSSQITIGSLRKNIEEQLRGLYPPTEISAFIYILFRELLGMDKKDVLLNTDTNITFSDYTKMHEAVERLKNYEPLQYILGTTEFYGCHIMVNPAVLIPRPETEELVQWVLEEATAFTSPSIADICTGSGCIAVAIKKKLPDASVFAFDNSTEALATAKKNAVINNVDIQFFFQDILRCFQLPRAMHIIVSNPPYVRESEKNNMQPNVLRFEPQSALFVPDNNPLIFYRALTIIGKKYLLPKGKMLVEINENMAAETMQLFNHAGYTKVLLRKDINNKPRMICAIK